jgi:hypothetical protein
VVAAILSVSAGLPLALLAPPALALLPEAGRRGVTWDAQVEGGVAWQRPAGAGALALRGRGGVLLVREPIYFAAGATAGVSPLGLPLVGAQLELTHLFAGVWGQLGLEVAAAGAQRGDLVGHAGLGFSVVGVEVQQRLGDGAPRRAWIAKVRVPISIIVFGLTR